MRRPIITGRGQAIPRLYSTILESTHTLIAGSTGSGKSCVLHGIINSALEYHPNQKQMVLIDPKRVELSCYRDVPHTAIYANTFPDIVNAIRTTVNVMHERYQYMERTGCRSYQGTQVYVCIDEYIDLKIHIGKQIESNLMSLATLGRAAGIHIILCTQRPTRDVITGAIRANFPSVLGLRTDTKVESRNIISISDCYDLPLFGYGYYKNPALREPQLYQLPKYDPAEENELIQFYLSQLPKRKRKRK